MAEPRETYPAWYTDLLDAIDAGEATYLVCTACGVAELPPRRSCPACGSTDVVERELPETGTAVTFTRISVTIEKFADETPYTVVLVELGEGVRLTGQLRDAEGVEIGDELEVGVERRESRADVLTFRPP